MIRAMLVIAGKDLLVLMRDPVGLFWVFAFPVLFALLFGVVTRGAFNDAPRRLELVVADQDGTPQSAAFLDRLAASGHVRLRSMPRDQGVQSVRKGDAAALVVIESGFGSAPRAAAIGLGSDPTRGPEQAVVRLTVGAALASLGSPARAGAEEMKTLDIVPQEVRRDGWETVFPMAMLWGLMACAATFAIAIVTERVTGTLMRLWIAPVPRMAVFAGKTLACFTACMVNALVLVGIGRLAFGLRTPQPLALLGAIVAVAVCFSGLSMLIGTMGRSQQAVTGAGWGTLVVLAMVGGAMIPAVVFPDWMLTLSPLSPVRWGIRVLEGAWWRGVPLASLSLELSLLVGFGIVFFAAGSGVLSRADR
jgi:ABC-2 type transport system permease protein